MLVKNVLKHFKLITKHKWIVFKLSCKIGIPIRGLLHDLSKYSWTEFSEGVKYYNGKHSPITDAKKANGYSKAWLHHKGRNKHHTEYWVDLTAPEKAPMIPYKYVAEMICDKMAAGIVYEGENWTKETEKIYWENERDKIVVHQGIKNLLTEFFNQVSEGGIDKAFTKENVKQLYKKHCIPVDKNQKY